MAALFLRQVETCRSRQFSERLRVPPRNHLAKGGCQSRTEVQRRDQVRVSACSDQKPSGSLRLRSYSLRYSSRLLTCAALWNAGGGAKTRPSLRMVSMSADTADLPGLTISQSGPPPGVPGPGDPGATI